MYLFTVIIIVMLTGMELDLFVPSFPELQEVFHLSPFMVEMTLSINMIAHCVAAFVAGTLGDRYGRKPVIVGGLIIFIIGSIACVFATSYNILLLGRLLQGVGISGPSVLAYVLISDKYSKKQSQYLMGIVNGVITVAMACAPVIGSYVNLFFNWRGNFVVLLILGILSLLFTMVFIQNKQETHEVKISLKEYKPIFQSRKAVLYLITLTMACQSYWVFIGMSSILYMNDLGVELKDFGLYQGAIAAVFAIGSLSSSYFLKRFGTTKCFIVAGWLVVSFFVLAATITILNIKNPLVITLVMLVQAISMVYPINILWPLALDAVKGARGRMGAMLVTWRLVVSAIAIELASYFYNESFLTIGTTICITLAVGIMACYMLIKEFKVLEFYDVEEV
jgi:DHA1 family bicyclomycin/chloramphenicol resistance-like MFS transporter